MKLIHIAVVDDDNVFTAELKEFLGACGYAVAIYKNAQEFLVSLRHNECDLLLVGWSIPDLSGIEVLEYIRKFHADMPAIMLTNRSASTDVVRGFEAGADDYMSKPVDSDILRQRIKSLLRRCKLSVENRRDRLAFGPYLLEPSSSTVFLGDEAIILPKREFDMAMLFFANLNQLVSRQYLASTLWGKVVDYQSRTIDTHIARLRKNLKLNPASGISLNALYGFGYILQADENAMNAAYKARAFSR
ncbi:MAG: response regulator transcription factor [Sphingorhabdus sp.]